MDTLLTACADLKRRGRTALIVTYCVCGDDDVRLQVADPSCPWVVEVLGPCDGVADLDRWHAVQIDAADRIIWRGPPRSCCAGELAAFAEDLLLRFGQVPASRYQRLR